MRCANCFTSGLSARSTPRRPSSTSAIPPCAASLMNAASVCVLPVIASLAPRNGFAADVVAGAATNATAATASAATMCRFMFSLLRGAPASVRDDERLSHTWGATRVPAGDARNQADRRHLRPLRRGAFAPRHVKKAYARNCRLQMRASAAAATGSRSRARSVYRLEKPRGERGRRSGLDLNAAPEGDVVLDLRRRLFRIRVVPGRVLVRLAI